ncbi:aldo/keto reductase [Sphingomonas ginsenosidivorax]|uniref:Aldo/keto reductase n=1 Tax=Sphingomonas ginsenosidivorax TaxID=862135 RepID=A0A5C6U5G8_9SPHN|nr:aldo/keto reductase [Sphingomonas ginsenosidivorax]TXC68029.1 aldo/keto reductase [Sphingomonas ginsenosidivorax]
MIERKIPSSGEMLPVIGCGTYRGFDVSSGSKAFENVRHTVDALLAGLGELIDTSPMYGRAEFVVGEVLKTIPERDRAFLATKVWIKGRAAGIAQMERSLALLGTDSIDLMQVHNLLDMDTHLDTLKGWKAEGLIRYAGITHYRQDGHTYVAEAMRRHEPDFIQINYSLEQPEAEDGLLDLAAARGTAVIVNRPFGGGSLLHMLSREPLPAFAAEIGCTTWSQILLKFVLGHEAVTCAIPGTGNPSHMAENIAAADGDLVEARAAILRWWRTR